MEQQQRLPGNIRKNTFVFWLFAFVQASSTVNPFRQNLRLDVMNTNI
jgi:hypothetical protein